MLLKIPRSIFYRKILNHTFFAANGMIFDLWFPFLGSSSFKYTRLPDQVDTRELLSHTHSASLRSSNFLSLKPATASAASNKSAATKRNLLLDFCVQYIGPRSQGQGSPGPGTGQ